MPGQRPVRRSPLHSKALTLPELEAATRGISVVVCSHSSTPLRPLERMDAAVFVGVVKLFVTGAKEPLRGKFVVFGNVPKGLEQVKHQRLGFSHLAVDILGGNLLELRHLYKVTKGFAFRPEDLGLMPLSRNGENYRWSYRCLINVEDM